MHHRPPFPQELKDVRWVTWVSAAWERTESINSLEMRAATTAIKRVMDDRDYRWNDRFLLLSDSSATVGSLSKGRSSSPAILRRCRRVAALCLAGGLRLLLRWIPTEANPA